MKNSGLKVIAPASVSNLACGFDTLGLALEIPCDEIIGRWVDTPGVHIIEIRGEKKNIPYDADKNINIGTNRWEFKLGFPMMHFFNWGHQTCYLY